MACVLKRNDETVAMLVMLDTFAWIPKALRHCNEYMAKCAEMTANMIANIKVIVGRHAPLLSTVHLQKLVN